MRQHLTILGAMPGASKGTPDGLRWLAAVLPAACVPVLASLLYFQWLSDAVWVQTVYLAAKAFTVVWPVLALALLLDRRPLLPAPHWPRDLRALPMGLLSGLLIVAALLALLATPLNALLDTAAPAVREKVATFGIGEHYWAFAVGFSVIHAGIEEYYWRWFLFGSLRRRLPAGAAHALAAVAFAAHHVVVGATFFGLALGLLLGACVAAGGVIWSLMLARQDTLAGAWLSHILVDLGLAYVGYRLLTAY
ncbi:CPBP family intramembrane metalloprotease [Ectothiorhodospiraceae bacterium WFHF3C12]|nr:CPBP family intramembrane metalloprotease [Ectothiorhodospiraceae bacterium WFHF3C12]